MCVLSSKNHFLGRLVLPFLIFISPSYAFTNAETTGLMKQCVANTQQQYGYSLKLSRDYCTCSVTRTKAYMKKHNLKEGVKPPPGTDKKAIAEAFTNIPVQCAREILAR